MDWNRSDKFVKLKDDFTTASSASSTRREAATWMIAEPLPDPPRLVQSRWRSVIVRHGTPPILREALHPPLSSLLSHLSNPTISLDTPSAAFYRLYNLFVIRRTIAFRNELEYIYNQAGVDWRVVNLPDPGKSTFEDARQAEERKVVMAGLTKVMCDAFNILISHGLPRGTIFVPEDREELSKGLKILEEPPAWATSVTPLKEELILTTWDGKVATCEADSEPHLKALGVKALGSDWKFT